MTQEEISKVAQQYAEENAWYPGETSYESDNMAMEESFANAFKAGALWRINSVWHTTADMPEKWKLCLVEYKDSDGKNKMRIDWRSEYEWVGMCHYDTILRWAYISDLLPEGGAQ